jgi:NAD(P)-dependent dehydrogenase (short-subunit alcohol dehydrogenase family)
MTESTVAATDPFRLDGRVAVVSGAARGIGFAIAARMLASGADVVVNDIDADALEQAKVRLQSQAGGQRVHTICADVAERDQVADLVAETVSELGSLDILVNNAGFYAPTPLEVLDPDVVDRLLDVNVKGLLYMSAAAAKVMKPGSAIVHISSLGGLRPPFGGLSVYHATKGAVDSLTRDMALSWGPRGIRVNSAAPGGIMTEGGAQVRDSPLFAPEEMAAITERATNRPLGRMGYADDLAPVVVFLASPAAGFITGQMLLVDGGYYYA